MSEPRSAGLFRQGVVVEEDRPQAVDEQLFPDELAHIARAVPKRRAEFGMARVCARRALARLGVAPRSLAPYPDRAPRWPENIIGSITHTHGYCAAAVAPQTLLRSLGIDAERERPLEPELVRRICTEREQRVLAQRADPARDALVYFAAKEAFYKCQYPLTRAFLDFLEVEADIDFDAGAFRMRVCKALANEPDGLHDTLGRFRRVDGLVLCASELAWR